MPVSLPPEMVTAHLHVLGMPGAAGRRQGREDGLQCRQGGEGRTAPAGHAPRAAMGMSNMPVHGCTGWFDLCFELFPKAGNHRNIHFL